MKEWRVVLNIQAETADEAVDAATELLNMGGEPYSVTQVVSLEGDTVSPEAVEGL